MLGDVEEKIRGGAAFADFAAQGNLFPESIPRQFSPESALAHLMIIESLCDLHASECRSASQDQVRYPMFLLLLRLVW